MKAAGLANSLLVNLTARELMGEEGHARPAVPERTSEQHDFHCINSPFFLLPYAGRLGARGKDHVTEWGAERDKN